jgi:hypothetical protein
MGYLMFRHQKDATRLSVDPVSDPSGTVIFFHLFSQDGSVLGGCPGTARNHKPAGGFVHDPPIGCFGEKGGGHR